MNKKEKRQYMKVWQAKNKEYRATYQKQYYDQMPPLKRKLYRCWCAMKSRCNNPKNPAYPKYGGRGIKICDKWLNFEVFYKDMAPSHKEGLSLDRVDNNGNYCKENCRWATRVQQIRNRSISIFYKGKPLMYWSIKLNIKYHTILSRLWYGWTMENALSQPVLKSAKKLNNKERGRWWKEI